MPKCVVRCIVIVTLLAAIPAWAQRPVGGTITGVVRDASSHPIADVDVTARPGTHHTRTDSVGRFSLSGLAPDAYSVRARKIGYVPNSWDVELSKSGRVDITFALDPSPAVLDTVVVTAERRCPLTGYEGFLCRRHQPGGVYFDDMDIDTMDTRFSGELFRGMPGFRVDSRIGFNGPRYLVQPQQLHGCLLSLVDGRPVSFNNPIPELSSTLIAVEIYTHPDSLPPELREYAWPKGGDVTRTGRCTVVVYWTNHPGKGPDQPPPPPKPVLPRVKPPVECTASSPGVSGVSRVARNA